MSIQDGSVEWQKDFIMGLRKLPLVVGYNKKQTFTSSGTFTPTMTGLYRITLQGGGGGGGGYDRFQGTPGGAGIGTINSVTIPGSAAASGATGYTQPPTGVETTWTLGAAGRMGWGYGGQSGRTVSGGSFTAGSNGGDGYIKFEWFDPSEAFPDIWAELEPSE